VPQEDDGDPVDELHVHALVEEAFEVGDEREADQVVLGVVHDAQRLAVLTGRERAENLKDILVFLKIGDDCIGLAEEKGIGVHNHVLPRSVVEAAHELVTVVLVADESVVNLFGECSRTQQNYLADISLTEDLKDDSQELSPECRAAESEEEVAESEFQRDKVQRVGNRKADEEEDAVDEDQAQDAGEDSFEAYVAVVEDDAVERGGKVVGESENEDGGRLSQELKGGVVAEEQGGEAEAAIEYRQLACEDSELECCKLLI